MKILLKLVLLTLVIPCYVWSAEQTEWEQARSKYNQLLSERKYDAAIEAAKSALIIAKKEFGSDSKYYASNYGKIGEIYYLKGDYGNALKYMTESLDLKKKAFGDTDVVYSQALHNISTIYQQMGMHKQAEPLLIEAIDIKKKTLGESDTSYAKSIHMLAELYQTIGDYGKSEEQFKKALEIKRKNLGSDNPSLALSIQGLGNLYLALGNFGEASKCYEEIVGIYTKIVGNDSPTTFAAESKLTKIYLSLGETEKANGLIKKSQGNLSKMSPKNPDYVVALYNSAMLHWELKEFAAAEADLKKTLKVLEENYTNTHYLYSSCLSSLGIITWVQGKLKEALQYMGNAAFLREKLYGNNNPILASTYHGFAGMLKEAGDHSKAKEYYKKAFDLYLNQLHVYFPFLSDSEKAKFDAKIKENFNMFNNYVLERYSEDPSLAADLYNYRLATKAILLNSSKKVRESIGSSGNKELIKKFEQWREVRANLSQLYNLSVVELKQQRVDINSLEKTANTLEKEISAMSSEFRNEYSKERVAWRDVKDRLGEGEAAIEIIRFQFFDKGWSDKVYYAFLIVTKETKEYPELIVLDYGNKMENAYIKNYVNSMKFKIDDKDSYGFYWSKIDEKLNGINTIYLSQDGIYNKINLNTLLLPDGSYFLESKNVVYLSNTKDIAKNLGAVHQNKKLFLLGNPNFEKDMGGNQTRIEGKRKYTISKLPGTAKELELIEELFMGKDYPVDVFQQDFATENTLKNLKDQNIIHLATHGYFEEINAKTKGSEIFGVDIDKAVENPLLRSGLLFAGASNYLDGMERDQDDNGVMTAYEAMNLNLENIDLVVLSACDTGLGDIQNGEGVYGLQRSFLVAGADKVMMSLWKVDDNATQELIVEFYKSFLQNNDYRQSLKSAQMELMKKNPHPYYWGAFLIIQ